MTNKLTGDLVAALEEIERLTVDTVTLNSINPLETETRPVYTNAALRAGQALANHDPALVDKVIAVVRALKGWRLENNDTTNDIAKAYHAITPEEWEKLL